jgi:hypothetical protein
MPIFAIEFTPTATYEVIRIIVYRESIFFVRLMVSFLFNKMKRGTINSIGSTMSNEYPTKE